MISYINQVVSRKGFEPMTLRLGILRSIQLSYQDKIDEI